MTRSAFIDVPNVRFSRDSVEKLRSKVDFSCHAIWDKSSRFLRGAHFTTIHVKLGHFAKVLGGCGEKELIISAAGTT